MRLARYLLTQSGNDDCGITTLRMALAYINKDKNFLFIEPSRPCTNFLTIKREGEEQGLYFTGFALDNLDYLKKIKQIFIAQLMRGSTHHFVLCYIKGDKLYVNDPSGAHYVLKLINLTKLPFTHVLILENWTNKKADKIKKPKPPLGVIIMIFLFSLFVMSGFYFLGSENYSLLSYIFFTLAAITKIIEHQILLKYLSQFDETFLVPRMNEKQGQFKNHLARLLEAKTIYVKRPLDILNGLITLFVLLSVLVLNNPTLIPLCSLLVMFAFLENFMSKRLGLRQWTLEKDLSSLETLSNAKRERLFLKISKRTNHLAKGHVYQKIIVNFIIAVALYILMSVNDQFSLNYFIFNFFAFSYLHFELNKLMRIFMRPSDYYRAINLLKKLD